MEWSNWIYLFIAVSGLSLVGVATILIKLGSYLEQIKHIKDDITELKNKEKECPINLVEKSVIKIKTMLDIYFRSMGSNIADALREHNKLERDALIDKYIRGAISQDDLHKLMTMLRNDFVEARGDYPNVKVHKVALANLMAIIATDIEAQ